MHVMYVVGCCLAGWMISSPCPRGRIIRDPVESGRQPISILYNKWEIFINYFYQEEETAGRGEVANWSWFHANDSPGVEVIVPQQSVNTIHVWNIMLITPRKKFDSSLSLSLSHSEPSSPTNKMQYSNGRVDATNEFPRNKSWRISFVVPWVYRRVYGKKVMHWISVILVAVGGEHTGNKYIPENEQFFQK